MTLTAIAVFILGILIGYGIGAFRNPICWWKAIRDSIGTGERLAGHSFVERERLNHCIVQTNQCERCGEWDVGWMSTARSTHEPHPDQKRAEAS